MNDEGKGKKAEMYLKKKPTHFYINKNIKKL